MNGSGARPVSDLELERFRLGELPPDEMRAMEARLAADADLRARSEALAQSDAEIASRYAAPPVTAEIRRRVATTTRETAPRWRLPLLWLAPAAAMALIVLAVWGPGLRSGVSGGDVVILKGTGPSLVLYRRTPGGSERIEPGARAHQGDQVRVGYRAAGRRFGAILSVDRTGTVTPHLPTSGGLAVRLETGGATMLDSSYELDAAPGWERFYFFAADAPFDLEPLRRALRESAAQGSVQSPPHVRLPKTMDQFVFTLAKDDRE